MDVYRTGAGGVMEDAKQMQHAADRKRIPNFVNEQTIYDQIYNQTGCGQQVRESAVGFISF